MRGAITIAVAAITAISDCILTWFACGAPNN
jgi:hypothetical protein